MQDRSDLSFFSTKKKPAPAGEDDGRIMPALSDDWIYSLIAKASGAESEYSLPLAMMYQGNGRNHRNDVAEVKLLWLC